MLCDKARTNSTETVVQYRVKPDNLVLKERNATVWFDCDQLIFKWVY